MKSQDRKHTNTYTEAKITEGNLELYRALSHLLHLVTESLEALLQLVPQLPLCLLSSQVVPVVHVLVLTEIRRDLANLSVELHVLLLLLSEQDRVLLKKRSAII